MRLLSKKRNENSDGNVNPDVSSFVFHLILLYTEN